MDASQLKGEIEDHRGWTWFGPEAVVVYLAYVDYDRWCPSAQLPPSVIAATAYGLLLESVKSDVRKERWDCAMLGRVRRDADEAMATRLSERS